MTIRAQSGDPDVRIPYLVAMSESDRGFSSLNWFLAESTDAERTAFLRFMLADWQRRTHAALLGSRCRAHRALAVEIARTPGCEGAHDVQRWKELLERATDRLRWLPRELVGFLDVVLHLARTAHLARYGSRQDDVDVLFDVLKLTIQSVPVCARPHLVSRLNAWWKAHKDAAATPLPAVAPEALAESDRYMESEMPITVRHSRVKLASGRRHRPQHAPTTTSSSTKASEASAAPHGYARTPDGELTPEALAQLDRDLADALYIPPIGESSQREPRPHSRRAP